MSSAVHAHAAGVVPPVRTAVERAADLAARYAGANTEALIAGMIRKEFPGRIALVSSFGAEAAVLLHIVAAVEPALPIIFLDTGKLFGETLRYRDTLIEQLGLKDVRSVQPEPGRVEQVDPDGVLWYGNPDMCCHIRKVEPQARALEGFDAWFTGRKAYHGGARINLDRIDTTDDGRLRINPLADWLKQDIDAWFDGAGLPRHPLEADGFLSIGCMPCTDRVRPGEDIRAGRWRGQDKTECGIHIPTGQWRMYGID